ncbi:MAG: peptidyl-prolyl cis-trans isomerase D [Oleispira sp.]|jgi:peptidyl-prolyl cis-trans isomerase D
MLQNIRDNSQGTIAKIIVGFIIITFALFGIESIVALGNSESAPATVNGSDIQEVEILRLVEMQKNRFRQQFGENYDESLFNEGFLRQSALEQLIEQKVAVTQARELGGYVSTQSIDSAILSAPEFQQDGQFSSDRFKMVLRRSVLTPLAYRAVLEEQALVAQVQLGTGLTDTALPYEVKRQQALKTEQRDYEYVIFAAADLKKDIELSDDDIQAFYDANKQRYQTEEKVAVNYVVLNKSDIKSDIQVDEEEIEQSYQDYLDQLGDTEERKASHILIEVNDDRNDDAAAALAQQLSSKASSGEDFAVLAKEYSDDIGSKNVGGDLGYNTRGGFVVEFDDALFDMLEGQVSEPVKTEFGYHVIKLDSIRKPVALSLAEKRDDLVSEIKSSQLTEMFAEQSEALAAAAFENDNIENLVANTDLGLVAQTSNMFSRNQGAGIALNPAIRVAAFDEKVLADRELSDVIEVSADQVVVIGLSKHAEPAVKPLADVKTVIEAQLLTEKANALAAEKAEALVADIAMGSSSIAWVSVNAATYSDAGEAPVELNKAVFALPKQSGEVTSAKVAAGQAVARLKAVTQEDVTASAEEQATISQAKANESFYVYRQWAKANSDIERSGS